MDSPILRAEHEEFSRRIESEQRRQNKRIDLLEAAQEQNEKMIRAVEKLAANMENMLREQEKQGKRLEALESRDGEMWRKVTGYIVTTIVGILAGFIFTQMGI